MEAGRTEEELQERIGRVEEAVDRLDRALDRALLAGLAAVGLLTVPLETMRVVKWVFVAHLAATGALALRRSGLLTL